jgi:phospholipase/carboxylesterase
LVAIDRVLPIEVNRQKPIVSLGISMAFTQKMALDFVHIPAEVPAQKRRLLVVLHGLGDSLEGYRFLPTYLRIPGLEYLLVNAPDPYFTGYSWFDLSGNMEPGIVRSRQKLFKLAEQVEAQGFSPSEIGWLGFSQGCLMVLDLACRYPKAFGGVVGISGFVGGLNQYPESLASAARDQRVMVTHGHSDPLLPIESTAAQIQALKGMGLSIQWREYAKDHTIDLPGELDEIRRFLMTQLMGR